MKLKSCWRQSLIRLSALFVMLFIGTTLFSQVGTPKHENRFHHLFASHRDSDNLEDRYRDLSCALVLITAGQKVGTGFYVSADGDVVTASHVIGTRVVSQLPNSAFQISIADSPNVVMMKDTSGQFTVSVGDLDREADNWGFDLALYHTHRKAPCWLLAGEDKKLRPGAHLITLGYPGLASGSLTLYSGIMSARLQETTPAGKMTDGRVFTQNNDFIRVQMPISPGISGSPIIDDDNKVVGVVTSAGVSNQDVDQLIEYQRTRDQQSVLPLLNTIDLAAATAHLASTLREFASPGYGDAVPMSYLVRKRLPLAQIQIQSGH